MNIGEKIKNLRTSKMMTQSELAGDMITRNMLSRIEHGAALPSLGTISYLAMRLNVPLGFLLAEDDNDFLYRKMNSIANIRHAFANRDWGSCRDICESVFGQDADDEVAMILCTCWKECGIEELEGGRFHSACHSFDRALGYAAATVYDTRIDESEIAVCFDFLRAFSPVLDSDVLDESNIVNYRELSRSNRFCRYLMALERNGENGFEDGDLYSMHERARVAIDNSDFKGGLVLLHGILESESVPSQILLYNVICDLEICCRETEDFKGAYEYANERTGMREKLLEDI